MQESIAIGLVILPFRAVLSLKAERCTTMPDLTTKPTISIVVPFHNEEGNVTELYAQLHSVMEDLVGDISLFLWTMEAQILHTSD
jgi:hypothetical protein